MDRTMRNLVLIGAVVLGCSASGGDDSSFTCSLDDRNGTYLIHLEEKDGNCGEAPDQLGRLESASALAEGCELDSPDVASDDECKLERSYTCVAPAVADGFEVSYVAVTTQQNAGAGLITGTMSLTIRDAESWLVECSSTYSLRAERQ
jgi:hypothetical protein